MTMPTGNHTDWPKFLQWVPRRLTAFEWRPPIKLLGNARLVSMEWNKKIYAYCKPVPVPGEWHVSFPPYIALTTKSRWHFSVLIRFDDLGDYYNWPRFKIGRLDPPKMEMTAPE